MRNRVILAVIALTALVGVIGFWYYQRNIYSKEVLKLEILGPDEAGLAQQIEYTVKYKNNGNIRLEEPRLIFEFPKYSIIEGSGPQGGPQRQEVILDDIFPGEEKIIQFSGRLLGKEGDLKTSRAWLNYRPKNLKARYESQTSQTVKIKNVPITLEFDLPSKIESGGELGFRLNYFSNTDYPLSDLRIKMEYPSGFEFMSAKPQALEKTDWQIGLLNKAQGGRIEVAGSLGGEINEQKQFRAELGTWQNGEFVLLKEAIRAIQIVSPDLYISQQINGSPKYIASPGDSLHYEIFFKNIGNESFRNLFLVAKLEGKAFDFTTLKAPLAEFEAGDNSIIFDWRNVSDLQFLDAQEEGRVEFWISLKNVWATTGSDDKNLVITNKVYLSQARQEFVNKTNSRLEVGQRGYYQDEIFGNTGPIPPQAGKTTTYTVTWQTKNYYNDVKNAQVKATLAKGVNLTGKIFPEDTLLTFDSGSREVIWKLDRLEAGRGVLNSGPNVSFQVAVTSAAGLIGNAVISGEDEWTGQNILGQAPAINIEQVTE